MNILKNPSLFQTLNEAPYNGINSGNGLSDFRIIRTNPVTLMVRVLKIESNKRRNLMRG